MNAKPEKPWAGRFERPTQEAVERFTESVSFDRRLYREDIEGSIAHAKMLERCQLIDAGELAAIVQGLREIQSEIEAGTFEWNREYEDVHMNIEAALIEKVGDAGAKLHTARSRNDQVALDTRLWVKHEIDAFLDRIRALQGALVRKAIQYRDQIMPGTTHLQHAQPVLLAHVLFAHVEMLERDYARLLDTRERTDVCPLGAGALAGTTLPTMPEWTAKELGFAEVFSNSVDAVSDRDFMIEFVFNTAMIAGHLSRVCGEWVIWATPEFDFIDIDESYCTGSSIMPQKKNPDVLELIRGKTGRIYGNLMRLLTIMKGLPLAYNRDMQEDKEALFDSAYQMGVALEIMADMALHTEFKGENMQAALEQGYLDATALAEYLVARSMPFREAHRTVGRIVLHAAADGRKLQEVPLEELQSQCSLIAEDVYDVLGAGNCISRYRSHGSSSPGEVDRQIELWIKRLDLDREAIMGEVHET